MKAKVASTLIVVTLIVGSLLLFNLGELTRGMDTATILFLGFFCVIVAFQTIPAATLFIVLVREIYQHVTKSKKEAGVDLGQGS